MYIYIYIYIYIPNNFLRENSVKKLKSHLPKQSG